MQVTLNLSFNGEKKTKQSQGNGRLDSIASALKEVLDINFEILDYSEHSLKEGSKSQAISYVYVDFEGKKMFGVGIDEDIIAASIKGLTSAINRALKKEG